MKFPLVSVLMTAYNREKYIAEAIESVLASTYTNFELIIVDDCSIDKTVEIAKTYEAKDHRVSVYINEKNLGDYPNRNRAASYAKGQYLKYLDSDDKIFLNSLMVMVSSMQENPECGFAVSSRSEATCVKYSPAEAYRLHFFTRGILDLSPTATIINKEMFFECGGFKEIRNVSDLDLWLRMGAKYPVIEIEKDLVFWREHEGQEIKVASDKYIEYGLKIIKVNMNSEECPLTLHEKKIIIRKYKKNTSRGLLKLLIRRRNFSFFWRTWIDNELKIGSLFNQ